MAFAFKHFFNVLCLLFLFNTCSASEGGHGIWNYLFTNGSYNKNVRPVKDWSTPTVVNFSMDIIAVVEFNEVKQTLVVTSKLTFEWKDEYLTWDPAVFDNISHIHAPQSVVWKPYVVLENSVQRQSEIGTPSLNIVINYDGRVSWNPVEVLHTTCATDIRKFPFDVQRCSMVFEAIGYKADEMTIQSLHEHVHFHEHGGTNGWTITETDMSAQAEDEDIHIVCSLTLKRNPVYFVLNIFLPIVLLSLMNSCVFLLPVQSGEKASFVITVFLALAVFLTIVSGNLPENSENISLLNAYVFMSTLLSVAIAILTIIQIRLYHRGPDTPVSKCLIKIAKAFTAKKYWPTEVSPVNKDQTWTKSMQTKRRSVIDIRASIDENDVPRITYNTLMADDVTGTWPLVVKAFDNIFFLMFMLLNLIITTVTFTLAVQEEVQEEHDDH